MKKKLLLPILLLLSCYMQAQLLNGSFEDNNQPSLENWVDACSYGSSAEDAPPGGGQWSLELLPGQTQGCYQAYFYQIIPELVDGQVIQISGWAKTLQANLTVSIYLAKIDAVDNIVLLKGDTTSSQEWTKLTVRDTFQLATGEAAAVLLHPGLVGGPIGPSHVSFFDALSIDAVNAVIDQETHFLKVFPNPITSSTLYLETNLPASEVISVAVYDALGRQINRPTALISNIDVSNWLPGVYFLKIEMTKGSLVEKIIR
ncbi:MAG: hypothetical protein DHS20C18_40190 [Saprospiraceae bacterium]|nr:MAG: hypothetical protein DHS20C18_40190 [Saprospiraceae bacterium]